MNDNTQSIIIYRSRAEQERDEFLQEHPEVFGVIVGLILFLIIVGVGHTSYKKWQSKRFWKKTKRNWNGW